jgi:hypothetical protein
MNQPRTSPADDRDSRFAWIWQQTRRRATENRLRNLPPSRPVDAVAVARVQCALATVTALGMTVSLHLLTAGAGFVAHLGVGLLNMVVFAAPFAVVLAARGGARRAWLWLVAAWIPVAPSLIGWKIYVDGSDLLGHVLPLVGAIGWLLVVATAALGHVHQSANASRAARARRLDARRAALVAALE